MLCGTGHYLHQTSCASRRNCVRLKRAFPPRDGEHPRWVNSSAFSFATEQFPIGQRKTPVNIIESTILSESKDGLVMPSPLRGNNSGQNLLLSGDISSQRIPLATRIKKTLELTPLIGA